MRKQKQRGRFLVLDGPDGAGKSTQIALLAQALQARGMRVLVLREPGGTKAGEAIRAILLDRLTEGLSPLTETFLFEAARAQLVQAVIQPALRSGTWVLCDRFTLSTLVYQGLAGGLKPDMVARLSRLATGSLRPDRYLVLWVRLTEGLTRRSGREADRMESKGLRFSRAVSEAYRQQARMHPRRYILVDGSGTVERVRARVWARVVRLLDC